MTKMARLLLIGYFVVVAWGTLGPSPGTQIDRVAEQAESVQESIGSDADDGGDGPPRFFGLEGEEVGNVVMFVPLGLLVPVGLRRWQAATIPAAAALSATIELVQLAALDHRSPQWADIGWNTTGASIGFAGWLVASVAARRAQRTGSR